MKGPELYRAAEIFLVVGQASACRSGPLIVCNLIIWQTKILSRGWQGSTS